jgi:hypothetical protein
MVLTKNMRKMLDVLIKKTDNPVVICFFVSDLKDEYFLSGLDVETILPALKKQGAIEYLGVNGESFRLTEEGKHYKEIKRLEFKEFLFKSVLVPIAVAFITSITTTSVWPILQQWIKMMLIYLQQS